LIRLLPPGGRWERIRNSINQSPNPLLPRASKPIIDRIAKTRGLAEWKRALGRGAALDRNLPEEAATAARRQCADPIADLSPCHRYGRPCRTRPRPRPGASAPTK